MAQKSFSAQVSAWVKKTKARQEAVFKESTWRVIEAAQTPVDEGGHMPVVTGFLRASGRATLGEPSMPVVFNTGGGSFAGSDEQVSLVIANATIGSTISFVYTANYAMYVESKRGFVRLAAQRWPQIVDKVCKEAQARYP